MRSHRIQRAVDLEMVVEVGSGTEAFPDAVVDDRGVVYFDVSKASFESRAKLILLARPSDRFIHSRGRIYASAPHLRRHLPQEVHERFDIMVSVRREQAAEWAGPNAVKLGLFRRLVQFMTTPTNERSQKWCN